jgi:hypothetical protein
MADAQEIDAPLPKKRQTRAKKVEAKVTTVDVLTEELELTPEDQILKTKFDPKKKYMFELAEVNAPRELPIMIVQNNKASPEPFRKFKPYCNLVYTSQVTWKGERRNLRYYDGCTSIFQDEQPKDKELMLDLIKRTKRRAFLEGKFGCFGDERMLLLYLMICSWNVDSEFRTRTASEVFRASNPDRMANEGSAKMDAIEKALVLAREATEIKMKVHASYLLIPEIDFESGNEWTPKELRTLYREAAASNPKVFIESYGNKNLETKWYIQKALQAGTISNKYNPNKAAWKGSNTIICDISGIKSQEGILDALFEFSKTEAGEEFAIQLKALYS